MSKLELFMILIAGFYSIIQDLYPCPCTSLGHATIICLIPTSGVSFFLCIRIISSDLSFNTELWPSMF